MCTLTWARTAQLNSSNSSGYHIHFNRDESRNRSKALPPQLLSSGDVEFLAPIDQDALGTWIFVNSWGVSACLLNNYMDTKTNIKSSSNNRSRGLLVKDLSRSKNIEESLKVLGNVDIENYSPFDLYLFDTKQVRAVSWNGETRVNTENPEPFKSSSGFDTERVINRRKEHYLSTQINIDSENSSSVKLESLRKFHSSHVPVKSTSSVCMHRDDARTQSYTEISVNSDRASIRYSDGPPCEAPLFNPLFINLNSINLKQ